MDPKQILKKFISRRTKSPKVNKHLLNSLTACLFKEIDAQHFISVFTRIERCGEF